ncbi:HPP family protein [Ruixingdingia sedimenti]|uniref:HPP family protein n=1 Tax=Ruixingdingia sedimenti TaxID=3073604 RepID=A0ABU1F4U0_9RHOB|nr:HPP family protein [Xinfangfangia sp. LG-4]MDR5651482.1 HPP family protein [Xinfangfangia sp. LG-4]
MTVTRRERLHRGLRALGPAVGHTRPRDVVWMVVGAGVGLLICAALLPLGQDLARGLIMVAPMGATAVLLFATPNSPLAQPWSAVVGNGVAALVGVAVLRWVPDPRAAAALAPAGAILAMLLMRALHPPGGAVALTAVLSPELGQTLGFGFVLAPVMAGTAMLVAVAVLWHRLSGRVYPFRQPDPPGRHGTADPAPEVRLGLDSGTLGAILDELRQSANLGVADLARLIGAAEQAAAAHGLNRMVCGEFMSRDLVVLTPDAPVSEAAVLFARHGFSSLPVVGPGGVLEGVIFQLDLIRHDLDEGLRAAEVMTTDLPQVKADTPAGALLPLLADGGDEAIPVMEGPRIVGIVTRTDLLSALARALARG